MIVVSGATTPLQADPNSRIKIVMFPRPGATCTFTIDSRPEAREKPSAIAMATDSCRPTT